jgi:hypothetical protein
MSVLFSFRGFKEQSACRARAWIGELIAEPEGPYFISTAVCSGLWTGDGVTQDPLQMSAPRHC